MNPPTRLGRTTSGALLIAALVTSSLSVAAQEAGQYKGKSLAEALRVLQARGLQIVFTSATVRNDMRVDVEPRARTARQILDELLAPHGLKARVGPRAIIEVVRAEAAPSQSRTAVVGTSEGTVKDPVTDVPVSPTANAYREYV